MTLKTQEESSSKVVIQRENPENVKIFHLHTIGIWGGLYEQMGN